MSKQPIVKRMRYRAICADHLVRNIGRRAIVVSHPEAWDVPDFTEYKRYHLAVHAAAIAASRGWKSITVWVTAYYSEVYISNSARCRPQMIGILNSIIESSPYLNDEYHTPKGSLIES